MSGPKTIAEWQNSDEGLAYMAHRNLENPKTHIRPQPNARELRDPEVSDLWVPAQYVEKTDWVAIGASVFVGLIVVVIAVLAFSAALPNSDW